MKIKIKKSVPKKLLLAVAFVAVVLAVLFIYLYNFNGNIFGWQPFSKPADSSGQYEPASDEQIKAGNAIKEQAAKENASKPSSSTGSDQSASPTPQTNGKSVVSMYITSPKTQSGSTIQIRSEISTVTNTGTCTLSLTKDSTTVTKTASVQALPSSSTCQGFDIPVNELSQGSWHLALHFENDSLTADTTDTIVVQ